MTGDPSACLKVRLLTLCTHQHLPLLKLCVFNILAMFWLLDGTIDSQHRDGDDGIDVSTAAPLANNVVLHYFSNITVQYNLTKFSHFILLTQTSLYTFIATKLQQLSASLFRCFLIMPGHFRNGLFFVFKVMFNWSFS